MDKDTHSDYKNTMIGDLTQFYLERMKEGSEEKLFTCRT